MKDLIRPYMLSMQKEKTHNQTILITRNKEEIKIKIKESLKNMTKKLRKPALSRMKIT